MNETPKRPVGRPRGTTGPTFPETRAFRFMRGDLALLRVLAGQWSCTEAEALRRALRETARREGVE